jgi:hypothetical protein
MRRPDFLEEAAAPGCGRRDGTGPPPPASTVLRIALARDGLRPPLTPETSGGPQGQQSGQAQGAAPVRPRRSSRPHAAAAGRPYIRHQNGGILEHDSHHPDTSGHLFDYVNRQKITRLTGGQPQS